MIRSLYPADAPAVVMFLARSPVNEARTKENLGPGTANLMLTIPLLRGYLFERDRHYASVSVRRGLIDGLISMRLLKGEGSWEIDRILLKRGQEHICPDLIEQSARVKDRVRAERIFLRLDADSPAISGARQAGFSPYLTEYLYYREHRSLPQQSRDVILRPRLASDEIGLFRLYSAAVPLTVRNALGITAQEWHDSEDRSRGRELVLEEEGIITARVRIRSGSNARQIDIINMERKTNLKTLVNSSLAVAGGRSVYWLVAQHQACLGGVLEDLGFRRLQTLCCFSRQLTSRIREPQLAVASMGMTG